MKLEERGAWIIEVHLIRGQNFPILDWCVCFLFFIFLIEVHLIRGQNLAMLDWCVMVIDEGEDKREEGKEEEKEKEEELYPRRQRL